MQRVKAICLFVGLEHKFIFYSFSKNLHTFQKLYLTFLGGKHIREQQSLFYSLYHFDFWNTIEDWSLHKISRIRGSDEGNEAIHTVTPWTSHAPGFASQPKSLIAALSAINCDRFQCTKRISSPKCKKTPSACQLTHVFPLPSSAYCEILTWAGESWCCQRSSHTVCSKATDFLYIYIYTWHLGWQKLHPKKGNRENTQCWVYLVGCGGVWAISGNV